MNEYINQITCNYVWCIWLYAVLDLQTPAEPVRRSVVVLEELRSQLAKAPFGYVRTAPRTGTKFGLLELAPGVLGCPFRDTSEPRRVVLIKLQ